MADIEIDRILRHVADRLPQCPRPRHHQIEKSDHLAARSEHRMRLGMMQSAQRRSRQKGFNIGIDRIAIAILRLKPELIGFCDTKREFMAIKTPHAPRCRRKTEKRGWPITVQIFCIAKINPIYSARRRTEGRQHQAQHVIDDGPTHDTI